MHDRLTNIPSPFKPVRHLRAGVCSLAAILSAATSSGPALGGASQAGPQACAVPFESKAVGPCSFDLPPISFGAMAEVFTDTPPGSPPGSSTDTPAPSAPPPTTAPSTAPSDSPRWLGAAGGNWGLRGDGPRGDGNNRPKFEMPSEEELVKIKSFMQESMPKSYEAMTATPRRQYRLTVIGTSQYRRLQRVRQEHPDRKDLADAVLDDCHSWDELGELFREWVTADEPRREEIRKLARPYAAKIYENSLTERHFRLENLKQSVAREEDKLTRDEAAKDEMIDKRLTGMIQDLTRPGGGVGPGNGSGAGVGGGRRRPAPSAGGESPKDESPAPPAPPAPIAPATQP